MGGVRHYRKRDREFTSALCNIAEKQGGNSSELFFFAVLKNNVSESFTSNEGVSRW